MAVRKLALFFHPRDRLIRVVLITVPVIGAPTPSFRPGAASGEICQTKQSSASRSLTSRTHGCEFHAQNQPCHSREGGNPGSLARNAALPTQIGFDWLRFVAPEIGAYYHKSLLEKTLHQNDLRKLALFFQINVSHRDHREHREGRFHFAAKHIAHVHFSLCPLCPLWPEHP